MIYSGHLLDILIQTLQIASLFRCTNFFFFFFFQVNLVGLQPPSPFTFSLVVEVMSLGLYQDSKHRRQVALETQFARQA